MSRATYPLDVEPLGLRLGEAEAGSVDKEARDAQQLHCCPDQARGDHVVDKESAIVWEENAPAPGAQRVRAGRRPGEPRWAGLSGAPGGSGAPGYSLELDISLVQKVGVEEPAEKKVQAGAGRRGATQREGELQSDVGDTQRVCALPCPWQVRPLGPYTARTAPSATGDHHSMGACLLDGQGCHSWGYADT